MPRKTLNVNEIANQIIGAPRVMGDQRQIQQSAPSGRLLNGGGGHSRFSMKIDDFASI